jgi:hypothetical protein
MFGSFPFLIRNLYRCDQNRVTYFKNINNNMVIFFVKTGCRSNFSGTFYLD